MSLLVTANYLVQSTPEHLSASLGSQVQLCCALSIVCAPALPYHICPVPSAITHDAVAIIDQQSSSSLLPTTEAVLAGYLQQKAETPSN
jgi:hypothetical protein